MRKRLPLFLLSLSLLSCDPCGKLDCVTDDYTQIFRITSKNNGQDLLFGSTAQYSYDGIELFSVNGNDTTRYRLEAGNYIGNGFDSVLYADFFPGLHQQVFLSLPNGDIDTLQLQFGSRDTRCCGNISELDRFSFNQQPDQPSTFEPQELRK